MYYLVVVGFNRLFAPSPSKVRLERSRAEADFSNSSVSSSPPIDERNVIITNLTPEGLEYIGDGGIYKLVKKKPSVFITSDNEVVVKRLFTSLGSKVLSTASLTTGAGGEERIEQEPDFKGYPYVNNIEEYRVDTNYVQRKNILIMSPDQGYHNENVRSFHCDDDSSI